MNNFEKYTSSPERLEKLLKEVSDKAEKPWDVAFDRIFCGNCDLENCPDTCPHEAYRENPGWWLGLEGGFGMLTQKGKRVDGIPPARRRTW